MILNALKLIAITLIPALELRASIPMGILEYKIHYIPVFLICVIANFILGIVFYLLLEQIVKLLRRVPFLDRLYQKKLVSSRKKIQKIVDKYGELGVAIFIGIPLPMSGVYTGAIGSWAIGLSFKKFIIADLIGVVIAGVLVTIATFAGNGIWKIFLGG